MSLGKKIIEGHSKWPGQRHLEWLNAMGKHYISMY